MSDTESCCSSEMDICEFLSGFPPEELADELLAYATNEHCKPDKPVTTKYKDPARRYELEKRLRSLKMKEGETFDHFYYEEFEDLKDELEGMGRKLDNESLVYLILNALPPSWSTFVDRVVANGLDMVPWGNLFLDIESEEESRDRLAMQRQFEKLQVVLCGMMGARIEPIRKPQTQVKAQPQVVPSGMMGARIEPIRKPQPQVKAQPRVVQCGMMGARIAPIQKPQAQMRSQPRKPQPQVVQGGMMGARIEPNAQRKGKGKGKGKDAASSSSQQHQNLRQSGSRSYEEPEEVWVLGGSLTFG